MDVQTARKKQEELIDGALRTHCLALIYELKINDILNQHGGFLSARDICKEITGRQVNSHLLQRIMRYLANHDVFEEKYEGKTVVFRSTEVLKLPETPVLMYRLNTTPHLLELLEGKCGDQSLIQYIEGCDYFEYMKKEENKRHTDIFIKYMTLLSSDIIPAIGKITEQIKVEGKYTSTVVDVGGSSGQMMEMLYKEMPTLKCVSFDLAEVIGKVEATPNVEMVGGDMFKVETLPKCDVFFTKNILHNWPDDKCIEMMKNFYEVLPNDGLLLSVNYKLSEPGESKDAWWVNSMDIIGMELSSDSKERTFTEFEKLHMEAGFKIKRFVDLGPSERPSVLIVASKQ